VGCLSGILTRAAWAQEKAADQPNIDAALMAALEEVDAKSAAVTDLSATFEQTKTTPLLRKPLVSSGTVKVKGSKVRWDTKSPHPTVMLIDESQIRMYYPDQRTLEVFDVDESMRRITATPLPRLAAIREQFVISRADVKELGVTERPEGFVGVALTPRQESLRKHVDRVRVLIDRATGCATRVEITDADGDTTTIRFRDIRTNVGLAESDLELNVPEGTRIVKPLEGLRGGPPPERPGVKGGGRP
jgi:outer membrane lipoprotein-sorting protein